MGREFYPVSDNEGNFVTAAGRFQENPQDFGRVSREMKARDACEGRKTRAEPS